MLAATQWVINILHMHSRNFSLPAQNRFDFGDSAPLNNGVSLRFPSAGICSEFVVLVLC
jgi:hypothetical protein